MLVPITINIPEFQEPISLLVNRAVIRKITEEELKKLFGVKVVFENQRPKNIHPYEDRSLSLYHRLFSPDNITFHVTEFIDFPYFAVEVDSRELASDLLFLLRLLKTEHLLAPFGFQDNLISYAVFYPIFTTDEFDNFRFKLDSTDISYLINLVASFEAKKADPKIEIIKERYLHTLHPRINNKLKYLEWVNIIESIILNRKMNQNDNVSSRFKTQFNLNIPDVNKTQANEIYSRRSEVTHAGTFNKPVNDDTKLYSLNNLHLYTQNIIRAYIEEGIAVEEESETNWISQAGFDIT